MNLLRAYFICITLILSCKSNEHRSIPIQEDPGQNVYLTNQHFGLHEKMVHVLINGQEVECFELASKTLYSKQIGLEYNLTIDQNYLNRNQLYELVLNEADVVFLSNDLSLKSKNTFQAYHDCHQFLLVFESNGSNYKADLILIPLQRELVIADKNHYGLVCIEDKNISIDFRSEIDSDNAAEILKKTIFTTQRDTSVSKSAFGTSELMLPPRHISVLPDKLINNKITEDDEIEADNLVSTVKASDNITEIKVLIKSMNYPQTIYFLRDYMSDVELKSHNFSNEIRRSLEYNLIDKTDSSPKSLLPETKITPSIESGGYMTPLNISYYFDYLGNLHGLRTKFNDISFQFYYGLGEVLASLRTSSKDKEVFVTQIDGTDYKYLISINHLDKTLSIVDSLGQLYGNQLSEIKLKLANNLDLKYRIHVLPIFNLFTINGCGVFCANMAANLERKVGGEHFSVELLLFTQSSLRMRTLDELRDFLKSDFFKWSTNRDEAFDYHVKSLGFESTYKSAHREALAIVDGPDFKPFVKQDFRELIARGEKLQLVDLTITNMSGRWPSIKQDAEEDLMQRLEDWKSSSSSKGLSLGLAKIEEEATLAMFELLRRQVSKASKAQQDLLLWASYRPIADKLADDKKLSDKVFAVQAADGQILTYPQYLSQRREGQNLNAADQYTQFLLWLSLKADRKANILKKIKLGV